MPLTIINPRLITIPDHNLGLTMQDQINNGVADPDPLPYSPNGQIRDIITGELRPYRAGDRVSSDTNRQVLVNRVTAEVLPYDSTIGINVELALKTEEYRLVGARSVYVFRADDNSGYIKADNTANRNDGSARSFIRSTATANQQRTQAAAIPRPSPDEEQNRADDAFQPTPQNRYWIYQRRVNELSFTDERSSIRTGKFDNRTSTGALEFVINSRQVGDSIALINIQASEISYRFTRAGVLHTRTFRLDDLADVRTWYEYFFNDISFPRHFLITDLPAFSHAGTSLMDPGSLVVTLRNPGAVVSVGQVVFGNRIDIGGNILSSGQKTEEIDFSTTGRDTFGVAFRTVRASSVRNSYAVEILRANHEAEQRKLELVAGGKPAVFISVGLPNNSDGEYKSNFGELNYGTRQKFTIAPIVGKKTKSLISGTIEPLV